MVYLVADNRVVRLIVSLLSNNALLYDSLLAEGKQDDYEKLLGRISAFDFTGSIITALSGGVLANHFNYEFNYILSVISMGTAFVMTLLLEEPPKLKKQETEIIGAARYAKQTGKGKCFASLRSERSSNNHVHKTIWYYAKKKYGNIIL